jgi:hypothetical protein
VADKTQDKWLPGSAADGAAGSAPTAPHATVRGGPHTPTGPERFWTAPRWWLIASVSVALSLAIHYLLAPWSLLPQHDFEVKDTLGDLAIPVDLLQGDNAPEPEPPPVVAPPTPPPAPPTPVGDKTDKTVTVDGGVSTRRDAGRPHPKLDAGQDSAPRSNDAGPKVRPKDAGVGVAEDAAIAQAGQVSGSARDAVGMIGAAGGAQAGPQNVVVTINMAVIRTHPVGARMGPLLSALPQWDDFLAGTGVDPVRDTDWVSINGPSLVHSDRDVILVHYSTTDLVVDRALDVVGRKTGNGGPYDAGVPGMKAILGHADRADRIFMRPQPHVLAVVPVYYAPTAARMLARATIPRAPKRPGEALRLTLIHPHGPMPAIPESVTELRLWIVPRNSDGGADVFGEGDTADPATCRANVEALKAVVRDQNSFGVKLLTHGLLDGVELAADGATLRLHAPVSRDQLEVLLAFAAGRLGVDIAPLDGGAAAVQPPR